MNDQPIIVIGAGVCGLSVATELVARGRCVSLVDAVEGNGEHQCSWWAGGMLAPYCEAESAEDLVVKLGLEAASWWEKCGIEVTRNGSLVLALGRDHADLRRFARRTSHLSEIDQDNLDALEPDLAGRFTKGLFFDSEAHLAPRDAIGKLRTGLQESGISFVKLHIDSIFKYAREHTGSLVIDCRGLAAADTLPELRGVKGEMLIVKCPDVNLNRPVRLLHPRIPLYVVPRGDGIFMIGATMLENNERSRISARSMLELLSSVYALNPAFGEAEILEIGVDARPAFPDNLPRISREGNIISVNGLYRHGFLLAPAMARMLAELVCDNKIPEVWHENSG